MAGPEVVVDGGSGAAEAGSGPAGGPDNGHAAVVPEIAELQANYLALRGTPFEQDAGEVIAAARERLQGLRERANGSTGGPDVPPEAPRSAIERVREILGADHVVGPREIMTALDLTEEDLLWRESAALAAAEAEVGVRTAALEEAKRPPTPPPAPAADSISDAQAADPEAVAFQRELEAAAPPPSVNPETLRPFEEAVGHAESARDQASAALEAARAKVLETLAPYEQLFEARCAALVAFFERVVPAGKPDRERKMQEYAREKGLAVVAHVPELLWAFGAKRDEKVKNVCGKPITPGALYTLFGRPMFGDLHEQACDLWHGYKDGVLEPGVSIVRMTPFMPHRSELIARVEQDLREWNSRRGLSGSDEFKISPMVQRIYEWRMLVLSTNRRCMERGKGRVMTATAGANRNERMVVVQGIDVPQPVGRILLETRNYHERESFVAAPPGGMGFPEGLAINQFVALPAV